MIITAIIIGCLFLASAIVIAACMLSARISETKDWGERPLREEGVMSAGHRHRVAPGVRD